MRPVHAPEDIRVQTRLQIVQGPVVRRSRYLPCNYVNRVVSQGGIDDFLGLDEHEPFPDADRHLISPDLPAACHQFDDFLELVVHRQRTAGALPVRFNPLSGTLKSLLEPSRFDWLEKVIHCVHVERLDRVLVERRHEDQRRRLVALLEESPCDFEAAETRHLNVQEDQIRFMSFDGGEGLEAVCRLAHDLDIAKLVELIAELVTRQLFIVDDKDSHSVPREGQTPSHTFTCEGVVPPHAVICCTAVSSGISMRALVPCPGSLVSWN